MAFDFRYPNKPANQRGWGPGAPNCQRDRLVPLTVRGVSFPGGVFREVHDLIVLLVEESLKRKYIPNLDDPGCWAFGCRMTKRSDGTFTDTPSNHSWGLAVDINAPHNPFRKDAPHQIGQKMADLWKRYGFRWLGPPIGDWMHFDFAGTPADAAAMTKKARAELGGDDMTDAEKERLKRALDLAKEATAGLRGVEDFLKETPPPDGAERIRKQVYRALRRAASLPE